MSIMLKMLVFITFFFNVFSLKAEEDEAITVRASRFLGNFEEPTQQHASSKITKQNIEERIPRSAPDALRYEPGLFVQQTAHSQGSAYIRGLTGQQTLLLFDGIRLNNSTYRQGPNQYFFTLDSQSLESISVIRGGASTRFGSDALGGVLAAHPLEANYTPEFNLHPRGQFKASSADGENGGRLQLEISDKKIKFLGGVGGRNVSLLEGSGILYGLAEHIPAKVPRLAKDKRTQLGTGFDEFTFDTRVQYLIHPKHQLTFAIYGYQQYNAPRTDQCPFWYSSEDVCTKYVNQFRHLGYIKWEASLGRFANKVKATLSFQNQYEFRLKNAKPLFYKTLGKDNVRTIGATFHAQSQFLNISSNTTLQLMYGFDLYHDFLNSKSEFHLTDSRNLILKQSRGQYLDGSSYSYGGIYNDLEFNFYKKILFRIGERLSLAYAKAPADTESNTSGVNLLRIPLSFNTSITYFVQKNHAFTARFDSSFRAPNLDDLTSRQMTGPGFQFENPHLKEEKAYTSELGYEFKTWYAQLNIWYFNTFIQNAILRLPKETKDCPSSETECKSSWNRYQLQNSTKTSWVRGVELSALLTPASWISIRTSYMYTLGTQYNRIHQWEPMSRISPQNGTVELKMYFNESTSFTTALRWAYQQTRLAHSDTSDARIPLGGTPGFRVFDIRGTYRLNNTFIASIAFENIFDTVYRYHGSSINGPARNISVYLASTPF